MSAVVSETPRRREAWWRVPAVVAVYTCVFFGALPALLWALGGRFDVLLTLPRLSGAITRTAGLLALCAGGAWMLVGMGALRWPGKGWPISHLPPALLVGAGPYAWSRHPIYVGYTVAFAGAGLLAGSLGRGLLSSVLLTVGWAIYAVGFEEPRLRARFGPAYEAYAREVPLVPLSRPLLALARTAWLAARPAAEALANRTVLFRAGRVVWVTYGALVAIGGGVAAALHATLLAGLGVGAGGVVLFDLGVGATMLVGGRLVWLAYEWRAVLSDPSIAYRRVGFVSFGGYLGLVAFSAAFAHAMRIDMRVFFDRALPVGLVVSAFGRLGCLSYGCCYGRACEHGLRWTSAAAKVNRERGCLEGSAPRVATPLLASGYAALAALLGACAMGAPPGTASATALLAYGVLRFGVEIWRDEPRFTRWSLTRGQLVSTCIVAASLALWFTAGGDPSAVRAVPAVLAATWPAAIGVACIAFIVCGYHREEVGRW